MGLGEGSPERIVASQSPREQGWPHAGRSSNRALIDLHQGHVEEGLRVPHRVWRHGEDRWLDAVCACYLAYGYSLRHNERRARRFLRKATRLHPQCYLLARYEALVEQALGESFRPGPARV